MKCPFCGLDHEIEDCPALTRPETVVATPSNAVPLELSMVEPPTPPPPAPDPPPAPPSGLAPLRVHSGASTSRIKHIYGMEEKEYMGLTQYSGPKYRAMNAILRDKRIEENLGVIMKSGSDEIAGIQRLAASGRDAYVEALISIVTGMLKIPKWEKTQYTLRGAPNFLVEGRTDGLRILEFMEQRAAEYRKPNPEGAIYSDKGLMSTTAGNAPFSANSAETAATFILFVTMLPDVKHGGRCIRELAKFVGEDEVLFMPDQEWYVVHTADFEKPCHKQLVKSELQDRFGKIVYLIAKPYVVGDPARSTWAQRARAALQVHVYNAE